MAQGFSLKDQLFNENSLSDLAVEYAAGIDGFDAAGFLAGVVPGLRGRELLARLDWIADCVEQRLSPEFPRMAAQLEAAMPAPLDPTRGDDDFGRFIHAVPGILAVRHGLEAHRDRALDLLHAATQRFSMEFYIRPFLNRWPEETMARLEIWAGDDNYHVRRLVSEGTRPRLPWAKKVEIDPLAPLPLLDRLHGDPTRYVTRSVANHLNDLARVAPDVVVARLERWQAARQQSDSELGWMNRHALRTLVKQGNAGALALLGYRADAPVRLVALTPQTDHVVIGDAIEFTVELATTADKPVPVLVDYEIRFARPNGRAGRKVYKLGQTVVPAGGTVTLRKRHKLKGNATTFTLHPGAHRLSVQVNGKVSGAFGFDLQG